MEKILNKLKTEIHIYTLRSKLRPSPRVSYRTPSGIRPDSRSYTGPTPRLSYPLSQPPPLPPDCTCVCPCSQLCYYCTLRSWMTSLTIRRSHFSVLFLTGKKTSSSGPREKLYLSLHVHLKLIND